jgi:hypothetical protein
LILFLFFSRLLLLSININSNFSIPFLSVFLTNLQLILPIFKFIHLSNLFTLSNSQFYSSNSQPLKYISIFPPLNPSNFNINSNSQTPTHLTICLLSLTTKATPFLITPHITIIFSLKYILNSIINHSLIPLKPPPNLPPSSNHSFCISNFLLSIFYSLQ